MASREQAWESSQNYDLVRHLPDLSGKAFRSLGGLMRDTVAGAPAPPLEVFEDATITYRFGDMIHQRFEATQNLHVIGRALSPTNKDPFLICVDRLASPANGPSLEQFDRAYRREDIRIGNPMAWVEAFGVSIPLEEIVEYKIQSS